MIVRLLELDISTFSLLEKSARRPIAVACRHGRQLDAMETLSLTPLEANILIQQSLNLPSLLSWSQDGEGLLLTLATYRCSGRSWMAQVPGIATIDLHWGWRIEDLTGFQCFGYSDRQCISRMLDALLGFAIIRVTVSGPLPELFIEFSNGCRLIGMATSHWASEWQIRMPKRLKICSVEGNLYSLDWNAVGPPFEQASIPGHIQ